MKRILFCATLLTALSLSAVRITEFMASNKGTIKDSFGESSDWVELYNDGETFSLDGWSLTDNENKPRKWEFPATNFVAGILYRFDNRKCYLIQKQSGNC